MLLAASLAASLALVVVARRAATSPSASAVAATTEATTAPQAPQAPQAEAATLRAGERSFYIVRRLASPPGRRLALVFHACTHSANVFFPPSASCAECLGLCEEALVAERFRDAGYDVVALSSSDRRSGCWSFERDRGGARAAIDDWHARTGSARDSAIVAFGASSGGLFAEQLGARGVVDGVFSQVAPAHATAGRGGYFLALASMPRDTGSHARARAAFDAFPASRSAFGECAPRPVDEAYLGGRLGLPPASLTPVVAALRAAGHLDDRGFLLKDPTRSPWRDVLAEADASGRSDAATACLGGDGPCLPLRAGRSSLAKALHVAWAFHEYCSDVLAAQIFWFDRAFARERGRCPGTTRTGLCPVVE